MRAMVLKSEEILEIMEVPMPTLEPGLVLVKVSQCDICGSDIRYLHGENPWAKQTLQEEVPNPPNIILGHELTGTVVDVFDKADQYLIGKRVGVNCFTTCGRCHFCRAGLENLCPHTRHLGHGQGWGQREFYPGGMAKYCPAFAGQVYELSDRVTNQQATFLDPIQSDGRDSSWPPSRLQAVTFASFVGGGTSRDSRNRLPRETRLPSLLRTLQHPDSRIASRDAA